MNLQIADLDFVRHFLGQSIGMLNPHEPVSCHESISVKEAIQILNEKKIGCILVHDSQDNMVGIFTERDALQKLTKENQDLSRPVSEYMTRNPHTAKVTYSLAHAVVLMSDGGFRHIPIVDPKGLPIGVISVRDILDRFAHSLDEYYDELSNR